MRLGPPLARVPLLLTALLLTLHLPVAAQSPESRLPFPPPEEVGRFTLTETKELEKEEHGTALRYTGPGGLRVDVYVYPVAPAQQPCGEACDAVAVREEADAFAELIPLLLERGYYETLRTESDREVQVGDLHGRHLRLAGTQGGRPVASDFYLFGAGDFLVKLRSTYPSDAASAQAVSDFATAFVGQVPRRARTVAAHPCPARPADAEGMAVEGTVGEPLAAVAPRVPGALRELGYELDPARTGPGTWTSLPRFTWSAAEREIAEGTEHPGIVVQVRAEAAGGSTRVDVFAITLCGVEGGRDAAGALEIMNAVLVIGKLTGEEPAA